MTTNFTDEQICRTTSYLGRINWSCIGLMIALLLSTSALQKFLGISVSPLSETKLYIAAIALAVLAIPISAKIFRKRTARLKEGNPIEQNLRIYRVAFVTKLVIICVAFIVNLFLFFFANNPHLLIIGAIYIVYQMIAIQSKEGIEEILGISSNRNDE